MGCGTGFCGGSSLGPDRPLQPFSTRTDRHCCFLKYRVERLRRCCRLGLECDVTTWWTRPWRERRRGRRAGAWTGDPRWRLPLCSERGSSLGRSTWARQGSRGPDSLWEKTGARCQAAAGVGTAVGSGGGHVTRCAWRAQAAVRCDAQRRGGIPPRSTAAAAGAGWEVGRRGAEFACPAEGRA